MVVGAALWAVTAKAAGLDAVEPQALALAVTGSLLPDIDHPGSWAGRKFKVVSVPLSALIGHRGLTHSAIAVLACLGLLVALGGTWAPAPVVVGYLSHLLADSLTPSGVPLLWPNPRRFTLNLCRTGSVTEIGLVAVIALAGGWAAGVDLSHLPRPKF